MPKDAVFECLVVCLSVSIEFLPYIQVACWVNFRPNNTLNIDYCFLTTIYEMDIRTPFSSYVSQGLNKLVSASSMKNV